MKPTEKFVNSTLANWKYYPVLQPCLRYLPAACKYDFLSDIPFANNQKLEYIKMHKAGELAQYNGVSKSVLLNALEVESLIELSLPRSVHMPEGCERR